MQADEIIQQKEWFELTGEEKAIVQELAVNEQEYNLLKKMLLVSAEETDDVPQAGSRVKEELRVMVAARKNSYTRYWYAAAAAVLLFIAGAIFLKKENESGLHLVKRDSVIKVESPSITKISDVPKSDSDSIVPVPETVIPKTIIAKVLPQAKKQDGLDDNLTTIEPVYASIGKTIADEKPLLDLVTEIY